MQLPQTTTTTPPSSAEQCEIESPGFPTPPPQHMLDNFTHNEQTSTDFTAPPPLLPENLDFVNPVDSMQKMSYVKKAPVHFIGKKDWRCCVQLSRKGNTKADKGRLNKTQQGVRRLLQAFYALYQEYAFVCDVCLPLYADQMPQLVDQLSKLRASKDSESETTTTAKPSVSQGDGTGTPPPAAQEGGTASSKLQRSAAINESTELVKQASRMRFRQWWMSKFKRPRENRKRVKKIFDKLQRRVAESLEVYERFDLRSACLHQVKQISLNEKGQVKTSWLQVPLTVELLLPKVQHKVETIMTACQFLADPLEVAAELRQMNYNSKACIDFFKQTKIVRDVIDEFVSRTPDINVSRVIFDTKNESLVDKEQQDEASKETDTSSVNTTPPDNNIISSSIHTTTVRDMLAIRDIDTQTETRQMIETFCQTAMNYQGFPNNKALHKFLQNTVDGLVEIRNSRQVLYRDVNTLKQNFVCIIGMLNKQFTGAVSKLKEKSIPTEQKVRLHHLVWQVNELKIRLKEEEKQRRDVFNMMQEQLGNIRVYCRCRDIPERKSMLEVPSHDTVIVASPPCEEFKFDKVFGPVTNQGELYTEFEPLVLSFIDGYNVCFITYGGEASGKTYTLIGGGAGISEQAGLIKRSLQTVLSQQQHRCRDWHFDISACIAEIYNDIYYDLLAGGSDRTLLHVDSGLDVVYNCLKNVPIGSEADVEALLQVCRHKRRIARTALNPASSRSHLVMLVRLKAISHIHGEQVCSYLSLVDLAGFEDIIKAQTQSDKVLSKEAGLINRSLTAFNRVFVALRRQDPNTVSYRESRLTHLLKPFLTNSGKCSLVVTVRTDKASMGSTQNTLRFGRETRGVKLGRAKRQVNAE